MKHRFAFAATTLLLATSAAYANPMTASEFEAYVTGKTLFFSESGTPYGAERYFEGRRVEWSFLDGRCKMGQWYPEGRAICFTYDDTPSPQCWEFTRSGSGLRAVFQSDEAAPTELYEAEQSDEPMYCMGPDIGA